MSSLRWMEQARCRELRIPPKTFFEDFERANPDEQEKTLKVCKSCRVNPLCAKFAEDTGSTGVFGGAYYYMGKKK